MIEDHADWIFDLAFSPDGKRLASASRDKTSKVFDVEKKESLVTFPGHAQTVYTVAFTPRRQGASPPAARTTRSAIWNPDDDGQAGPARSAASAARSSSSGISPDGKTLVACGADKTVRVFDAANGAAVRTLPGPHRLGLHLRHLPRRQDRSPRGAGTARSGSGTSPTASRSGPSSPRPGSSRAAAR